MPECGTILACETNEDCFVADPEAFCVPTRGGSSLSVGGFCETATIPLTYCEVSGFVEDVDFIDCHTLPYSDTLTSSWFDGDCDGDGCPNGADDDVCAASSGCGPATAPLRICPRRLIGVGPEQCTFGSSAGATVLSCATAHSCASDRMDCPDVGFMCRDGMCEPTICGSLYGCRQASDCEGTPFGPGTCVRAPRCVRARARRPGWLLRVLHLSDRCSVCAHDRGLHPHSVRGDDLGLLCGGLRLRWLPQRGRRLRLCGGLHVVPCDALFGLRHDAAGSRRCRCALPRCRRVRRCGCAPRCPRAATGELRRRRRLPLWRGTPNAEPSPGPSPADRPRGPPPRADPPPPLTRA
jgi:hypothetical protein